MAVDWSTTERDRLHALIQAHPVDSSACAELGRKVVPIGRERDANAHGVVIRPNTRLVRLLKPRHPNVEWWFNHVTVAVLEHGVDALAGVEGTPMDEYMPTHFDFQDPREVWLDFKDPELEGPI